VSAASADWLLARCEALHQLAGCNACLHREKTNSRSFCFMSCSQIFDQDVFMAGMHEQGMRIAVLPPTGIDAAELNLAVPYDAVQSMQLTHASVQHVRWVL